MANYHHCPPIYHVPILFAFTGTNKFLDWLDKVEHWFLFWRTPKKEQVSFATSRLSIIASEWWDELQISRLDQGKRKVRSWNRMKRILRSKFIPLDYCLVQ